MRKKIFLFIVIIFIVLTLVIGYYLYYDYNKELQNNNFLDEIKSHYNIYVKTNKEAILYNEDKEILGKLGNNVEITLEEQEITLDTIFFKITDFGDEYYIKYDDVEVIDYLAEKNTRYLNYIPFNQNIVTDEKVRFYDEKENLIYEFNKSFDLPIIIKDTEKYGVEFNGKLLYIKSDDIVEVKNNQNTNKTNASGVGVLNYHAFYDENNTEEKANCTTEICHSKEQFKTHLDYLKKNDIFTVTMDELEMYIDGKLQLPKSVLITIDDGPKTEHAVDMLTEYQMNATIFLVTSWFNIDEYYKTEYIELHSHTHDLHGGGQCPGGQGGGLKCLPEEEILSDLEASREALNGSKALCYPFYEYNDYTIRLAKKAGFTMGFIGESNYSDNLVHVGSDKFRLRRFVIVTYTTLNDLDRYFGQIK